MQTGSKDWARRLLKNHSEGKQYPAIALNLARNAVGEFKQKEGRLVSKEEDTRFKQTDFVPDDESYFGDF